MKITGVIVNKVKDSKSSLVAFANVTFDDELVVKGIKIVDGSKGTFVSMPSTKGADGKYYDDVFPITKDIREHIEDVVLDAYYETDKKKPSKRR